MVMLEAGNVRLKQDMLRVGRGGPRWNTSIAGKLEPVRMKLRNSINEPRCKGSNVGSTKSDRATLNTTYGMPDHAKVLSDGKASKWRKSKTGKVESECMGLWEDEDAPRLIAFDMGNINPGQDIPEREVVGAVREGRCNGSIVPNTVESGVIGGDLEQANLVTGNINSS